MAVSARKQLQFWGIGFALLCLVLWLLGSTLLPFLLGAGMAYFLDPLADRLERLGMNRVAATSVIAISGILALAAALIFAVPALIGQIQALVAATPDYIANLAAFLGRRYPELFGEHSRLMRSLTDVETMMREGGLTVANTVLVGALGVFQVLLLLVVVAGGRLLPAARLGPDDRQGQRHAAARARADHPRARARHRHRCWRGSCAASSPSA